MPATRPTPRECFFLGWTPPIVHAHFEGLAIIGRARTGATGELAARVSNLLAAWPKRGPVIVDRVMYVDAILQVHGLESPPPPRDDAGYEIWAKGVAAAAEQQTADDPTSPRENREHSTGYWWTYQLGKLIGDVIETLQLGVVSMYLLGGAPEHAFLCAETALLAKAHEGGRATLDRFIVHITQVLVGVPDLVSQHATEAARILAGAPMISANVAEAPAIEAVARQLETLAAPAAL